MVIRTSVELLDARVVRLDDGCVDVGLLVQEDKRRALQVLLLDHTLGALMPENQVNLCILEVSCCIQK